MNHRVIIEPFKIKTVEKIKMTTESERKDLIEKAHYNTFLLSAEDVIIDLLTDSGTSAMSADQWAGILKGDESYAGARSWYKMRDAIKDMTGYEYILPTHQGRAAEHLLYGRIGGKGKVFLSNTHFDTTRANIEYSGATAIDCPIPEGLIPDIDHPFKGNMDVEALEKNILKYGKENIAAVILTVTNNSGGGQPASLKNAREVGEICKKYDILYILDSCRIAENAYFIKQREEEAKDMSYIEIAREMFSYADGTVMSAKKDALVNMGGFLALKDDKLFNSLMTTLIVTEGFATYGGLSGRDMEAIAIGLKEVFEHDYLHYRIRSTTYLGEKLKDMGISVISPIGGHAVYIDAKAFYPHIPVEQFPGQALAIEMYKLGGIRAVEIGSVMFGSKDEKGNFVPAKMELVRMAIPRRVYTQSHIDYVVEVFAELIKHKDKVKGYKITWEPEFLRHFTAHFEPVG
ncbi:MAG TPA: aminotransferase class III-fold pyridoxal phosphate-dependent enzyme [Bacteroidetes bacterium]|nr:aminotransferase class III-fold pyridoxal phosphate-dependent enzyme [Bacteroidota bacterium]